MSTHSSSENIDRLIHNIREALQDCELYHNSPASKKDYELLEHTILAALVEANRIDSSNIEEIYDLKPLYDRVKAIVHTLRVARNNLERLEHYADLALDATKDISHSVEEPYDDHEL